MCCQAIYLIDNKLFVYLFEELVYHKFPHISCFDIDTGVKILTRDY